MKNANALDIKRNVGADIVRCLAFFLVVSVHFFLHNGYYDTAMQGERMLLMTLMRSFFIICVPLFMMLSGYLMRNKKPDKKYYGKFLKTYLAYALASLCCVAYAVFVQGKDWGIKSTFFGILKFSAAPYSWYVEMYFGLFLIIPFLNILYNNIPTKKLKALLILAFIAVTCLPAVVNVYNLESAEWWLRPSSSSSYTLLIPDWWVGFYPITYYFLGCYLSEYGFKMKKWLNFVLILLILIVSGLYTYWRSYKSVFIWGSWCDYNSPFNVVLTFLVFAFIVNLDYSRMPKFFVKLFKGLSGLCFVSYLVSWIFDIQFYPVLCERIPSVAQRLNYYVVIVPVVFVCSLVLSFFINKAADGIEKICHFIFRRKIKTENKV